MTRTFSSRTPIQVRRATLADLDAIAGVLAVAFGERGDLREGRVPGLLDRRRMYPPYFLMLGEHALEFGWVDITTDGKAAVVSYLRGGDRAVPEIPDYDARLGRIFGAYADGFRDLDAAVEAHHPDEVEHYYVQFVAVHPDVQRCGYGSTLLDHVHQRADALRLPCYLESTGAGPTALYHRHGYQTRPPFRIRPDGAELTPMWRPPSSTGNPATVDPANCSPINTSVMHPARRYNYWLGGKDNFAADRRSADAIAAKLPAVKTAAVQNRLFRRRVVGWLAQQGITQFLDVGTGLPVSPNTHEVAQEINPHARIVYVDNDPLVLTHARALLTSTPQGRTAYIDADLTRPSDILTDPNLTATLDLTHPVGLLLIAVLHFQTDDQQIAKILADLVTPLAPGSFVALTHGTLDPLSEQQRRELSDELSDTGQHGTLMPRPRERLTSILAGLDLEPDEHGLISTVDWRPDLDPTPGGNVTPADALCYAYVARRP